jgi:hypothetical protein
MEFDDDVEPLPEPLISLTKFKGDHKGPYGSINLKEDDLP